MRSIFQLLLLFACASINGYSQSNPVLAATLQSKYKDEKVAIINSEISYEFSKNKNSTEKLVKVLEKSKEEYLSLRFNEAIKKFVTYDNNSEVLKFNGLSSTNGKVVDQSKTCGKYTSEGFFYDDSKYCSQYFKLSELGELWTINIEKKFSDSKYLTSVFFQDDYPLTKKTVSFIIPTDIEIELLEFNFQGYNIIKSESTASNKKTITYTIDSMDPFQDGNFLPGIKQYSPHILVLSKSYSDGAVKTKLLSSTDDLYGWYKTLVGQLKPNPEPFKQTVQDLIQGKTTDEDKIKSIFYWIQDNIRYIAYEDGIAGFQPDDAQNVFEKKFGDCKGMANLTKEMLKVAGFDARLTWIGTSSIPYDYSVPSLAVDNHMICTVILNNKKIFLDATEDYIPFKDYAERIQNRSVMIEDGDKYMLDKVPSFDVKRNAQNYKLFLDVTADGMKGTGNVELNGEVKKDFQYSYFHTKNDEKEETLNNYISKGNKNFKVTEAKLKNLEQREGGGEIGFNYTVDNQTNAFNNELYVEIDPIKKFRSMTIKDTRKVDLDFGEKINYTEDIEMKIPEGYTVSELPENVAVSTADFSFLVNYKQEGNKILYKSHILVNSGKVNKTDFKVWNESVKKLEKSYQSQIVLKK